MPKAGCLLEVVPLRSVGCGDGMADVATKRLVVRIMGCAFFPTVQPGDGGVKAVIDHPQVGGGEIGRGMKDARHPGIIVDGCVSFE